MRNRASCVKDELPNNNLTKGDRIPHESEYNTVHEVSSIPTRSSSPIPLPTSCRGIPVEYVRTDNGFEFTNRFSDSKRDLPTLVERTAAELGIRHRLIRPYAPQHNGKVECSHRADQKRFYSCHAVYSLDDFAKQLTVRNRRSNSLPMKPLRWRSLSEVVIQYV